MANKYNRVYVDNKGNSTLEEINPEFVYLTIPADWVCVYHKLLVYMADMGKAIVDDCTSACKGNGKNIMNCWNMFQSAIACRTLNREKEANFFIEYIKKQLESLYGGRDESIFNGTNFYPISKDGKLKALCSCNKNNVSFGVDLETGRLYQEYLNSDTNNETFTIENDDLVVTSEDKV